MKQFYHQFLLLNALAGIHPKPMLRTLAAGLLLAAGATLTGCATVSCPAYSNGVRPLQKPVYKPTWHQDNRGRASLIELERNKVLVRN